MQLIRWLAHYTTLAAQIVSELWTTYPVSVNDFQGDREGRPYNRRLRVTQAIWYCRGDPRGRPGSPIVFLAIIHRLWDNLSSSTLPQLRLVLARSLDETTRVLAWKLAPEFSEKAY